MYARFRKIAVALAEIEIWPVALAVGLSLVSARLLPFALGVAGVFWAVRWLACGSPSVRTPADPAVLLLAVMALLSVGVTFLPEKTIPQVMRLGTGILLYYSIVNWAVTQARLKLLALGVVLAGLGLAFMAPFSVQWAAGKLPLIPAAFYDRFTLLVSDTVHPNVLAGNIVILIPLALALFIFAWPALGWIPRGIVVLSLVGMGLVLALTLSRGAWLALGTAMLALVALRWRLGWTAAAAVLAASLGWLLLGRVDLLTLAGSGSAVNTLQGRLEVWSRAVYMIQDFPFTGVGMGAFGDLADAAYPFFQFMPGSLSHAHNLFLQVAVDLGIPGLVAWLAILILVCAAAWRVYRTGSVGRDRWAAGLGAGLLCSQVALIIHGLTDAITWGMVRPAPLTWVVWGLAVASWEVGVLK